MNARAVAIGAVLAAMVLVVLNMAMVTVALPTLAAALEVTPATSIWVLTVYQAALLMALLPCAAFGESLGHRRVFGWGVALFTGASLLCALAPTFLWLVAARFLQGIGAAAVMALGVALLRQVVARERLGAAIGWNALAVALSSAAGPVIGAAILAIAQWPWLFAASLPLGVLVLLAVRALPDHEGSAQRTDLVSVLLNAGCFAALVIAAGVMPGRSVLAAVLLAGAVLQLMLLVGRERHKAAPLVPLDLLAQRPFRYSVIASLLCFAGQTTGMVALPFFLQHSLGFGTLMTGLFMMPWPLTVAIAAPFSGRLADRVSGAGLCFAGGMCLAAGLGGVALVRPVAPSWLLVPLTLLCGLGFSLFNVANNRALFLSAPVERSAAAGGMQGTARLLGQTGGAVIMALLFNLVTTDSAPQAGLISGALLAGLAALASLGKGGIKADAATA